MKAFLSKYWKRVLITITGIFILIDIVSISMAPHTLINEYAKYGADVKPSSVAINTSELVSEARESAQMTDGIVRIGLILAIGLIAAVIISELATKKAPAKKK